MTRAEPRAAVLVTNPASGGGRAAAATLPVQDALRAHGWRVRDVRSRDGADATRIGAEADPDELVVSLGGDGTHALVARGVERSGALFAALPGGRGNDFVRAIGASRDPVSAAQALAVATERRIDMGVVGATTFLGVVSIGYSARTSHAALASRVPGPWAYHVAAVRTLRSCPVQAYVLEVDGERRPWSGLELAVGQSGWYGGGLHVCPAAALDDGLLDVTCIAGRKRAFPAVLAGVFRGDHVRRREVSTFRAATLTVHGAGEVWSDGDLVGELPATITTRPGAVRLLAAR